MSRPHPDDHPYERSWGWKPCPRCGKLITKNARGRKSHINSCLKKPVTIEGKTYPPARG